MRIATDTLNLSKAGGSLSEGIGILFVSTILLMVQFAMLPLLSVNRTLREKTLVMEVGRVKEIVTMLSTSSSNTVKLLARRGKGRMEGEWRKRDSQITSETKHNETDRQTDRQTH